ncbi:hypothetical protein BT67DRAFT_439438 [Trichocladium antarcticum]|uniref:Uncharacterized protein n=1 Tax=Trichocladium antarcticum TaxID=1450529 RepID=A0AAN6UPE7_9PEZI|nr:hypothetical protein BT67DRAFT_439438 [Trichocladium antarcticum]
MSNFPKLIPAFTIQVVIDTPSPISPTLTFAPLLTSGGTIKSEPGYAVALDAALEHGADYIKASPDGTHVRLNVQMLARDTPTGALLRVSYTGKVALGGGAGRVLRGEAGAGTTEFGEAFTNVEFETGSNELAELHEKVYVGSGRFVLEAGKPTMVEYKVSEVSA